MAKRHMTARHPEPFQALRINVPLPTGGGVGALAAVRVDVRDMVCAQALAVLAHAMGGLAAGQSLDLLYNAEDVKRDVLAWARDRGHRVNEPGPETLRLQKRTP